MIEPPQKNYAGQRDSEKRVLLHFLGLLLTTSRSAKSQR